MMARLRSLPVLKANLNLAKVKPNNQPFLLESAPSGLAVRATSRSTSPNLSAWVDATHTTALIALLIVA